VKQSGSDGRGVAGRAAPGRGRGHPVGDGVPKVLGGDVELANFILGAPYDVAGTGREASRALLRQVVGVPARRRLESDDHGGFDSRWARDQARPRWGDLDGAGSLEEPALEGGPSSSASSRGARADYAAPHATRRSDVDWGRKFLPANAGSVYIDMDHLELASPEVRSAKDFVSASHAMLRVARAALPAANAELPAGKRIVALANNSDGRGNSYGSHLNVCMERRAWHNTLERRMHPALFYLAAFQVSSIVITGAGKVGAERGPAVPYQLSARADFFEQIVGLDTSHRRPLVNTRDESHCLTAGGTFSPRRSPLARLHCIFFDHTLCHVATYLKAGLMQLVVAMIETGWVDAKLLLRSPLDALRRWSRDPELRAQARLYGGASVTAVELQRLFLERARRCVDSGACDQRVPDAREILRLWADTLDLLEARSFAALARRLDWVLKLTLLERVGAGGGLDWSSPEMTHLDQIYASLDAREGLYWSCERDGAVDLLASDAEIDRFVTSPPDDTRAWTRAMLLRAFRSEDIEEVDWSFVRVRLARWSRREP
jgi:proteasome accessory factor A